MKEFTFLTKAKVDALNSGWEYGGMAEVTDFSILLRGASGARLPRNYYGKNKITGKKTGRYWTKSGEYVMPYGKLTIDDNYDVYVVDNDGDCIYCNDIDNINGVRPVVSYSTIRPFCSNITRSEISWAYTDACKAYDAYDRARSLAYLEYIGYSALPCSMSEDRFYAEWDRENPRPTSPFLGNIDALPQLEVCYGEYPQTIVDEDYSSVLEEAYNKGTLRTTGKVYSATGREVQGFDVVATVNKNYIEYEYNGGKYIRFVTNSNCDGLTLSNGVKVKAENIYWVRVEPIVWLVFERGDLAISKKIIFDGVPFMKCGKSYMGNFEDSFIYEYMNNYFAKEIIADRSSSRDTYDHDSSKEPEEDANKRVRKM